MKFSATECLLDLYDEKLELEDYQSGVPRWCTGCGDNAILAAVQRLVEMVVPLINPSARASVPAVPRAGSPAK